MCICLDDHNNGKYASFEPVVIKLKWVLPLIDKTTVPYVTETNLFHRLN